jgi:hypothetical protein
MATSFKKRSLGVEHGECVGCSGTFSVMFWSLTFCQGDAPDADGRNARPEYFPAVNTLRPRLATESEFLIFDESTKFKQPLHSNRI